MPVSGFLVYRLPPGVVPGAADLEAVGSAIDRLCPVPTSSRRPHSVSLAATIEGLKQAVLQDAQRPTHSKGLSDVWMVQMLSSTHLYLINRQAKNLTEADKRCAALFQRRLDYQWRSKLFLQAKSYVVGDRHSDVMIKVLQVYAGAGDVSSQVGLALEVVYLPCTSLDQAARLMQELAEVVVGAMPPGTAGRLEPYQPPYQDYKQMAGKVYGPQHLALAYTEMVSSLLKGRGQAAAAAPANRVGPSAGAG